MEWIALAVASLLTGKGLSFTDTLRGVSELMSNRHGPGFKPINYQNSITPPWLTKAVMSAWVMLAGSVVWTWYLHGWILGAAAAASAIILPGLWQALLPPRRGSLIYLQMAVHSLANRAADYARGGDQGQAAAAKMALEQLINARPDTATAKGRDAL